MSRERKSRKPSPERDSTKVRLLVREQNRYRAAVERAARRYGRAVSRAWAEYRAATAGVTARD